MSYVVSSVITSKPLRHPSALRTGLAGFIRLDPPLPPSKFGGDGRTSGPVFHHLSPHAISLTPGSRQVHVPFASLPALAFPISVKGRRVSHPWWVYPSTGLSQQYSSGLISRGCTVRFILRPADLAGTPDWVSTRPFQSSLSRHRVGASSANVLPR
jgi:hypothetical protein